MQKDVRVGRLGPVLKCYLAGWLTSASVSSCSTAAPEPDLALLHLPFCLALLLPLRPTMGCFQLGPFSLPSSCLGLTVLMGSFHLFADSKKLTLFGPQTALPVADRASPQVYPETPLPCVTQGLWDIAMGYRLSSAFCQVPQGS